MDFLQSSLQRFGCTDSGLLGDEESSGSCHLLKCPDLVIQKVLNYLQPSDLKTLRLACKTTKSWIEEPNTLKRLEIQINGNKKRMREVLKSRVLWNNFNFILSSNLDGPPKKRLHFHHSRNLFSNLIRKFGPTLKIVHMDSIVSPSASAFTNGLQGHPNFFEEFEKMVLTNNNVDIDIESISIDLLQFRDGCREEFEKMKQILKSMHLKHLKIREIDDYEFDLEGKSTFFEDILFSCDELTRLDVPCRISIPWKKRHEANEKENTILPVIKYLQKPRKFRLIEIKLTNIVIPPKADEGSSPCPLLKELSQVCQDGRILLCYSK